MVKLLDDRKHLQRGDEPIAGRGVVGQDNVAVRLAANVVAMYTHFLEHMMVTNWRAQQNQSDFTQPTLKPQIAHDGSDKAGLGEPPVLSPALGDNGQKLVAVDQVTVLVHHDHSVGVAVERDPGIGTHRAYFRHQGLRRGRAAVTVDVEPVRLDADGDDLGAKLPQGFGHDAVGRPVGAVDNEP